MQTVFHLSSDDPTDWEQALSNVRNLLADDSLPLDDVLLVANGDAVRLLTDDSPHEGAIVNLTAQGVTFVACENSLRTHDLEADHLLAGVETATSAVAELTRRQDQGYAYVKLP
jgi:hypothetical protein